MKKYNILEALFAYEKDRLLLECASKLEFLLLINCCNCTSGGRKRVPKRVARRLVSCGLRAKSINFVWFYFVHFQTLFYILNACCSDMLSGKGLAPLKHWNKGFRCGRD
jgi:hypothetical protein